ncbi:MAG: hypothetical protein AAGE52_36700 [Myxococcota bacterium]
MAFEPNKERAYGSTADVVSRLFAECGGVPKVTELLGLSRTRCYALADPDDASEISYSRVVRLTEAGARAAVHHLAAVAGGVFVSFPKGDPADWHHLAASAAERSAQMTASLLRATSRTSNSPGDIDSTEARALLADVDDLVTTLATLRAQLTALVDDEPKGR